MVMLATTSCIQDHILLLLLVLMVMLTTPSCTQDYTLLLFLLLMATGF